MLNSLCHVLPPSCQRGLECRLDPCLLTGDPTIDHGNKSADGEGEGASRDAFKPEEPYLVGSEALARFEDEVRKLRTMQAEALAGYHEVRFSRHTFLEGRVG